MQMKLKHLANSSTLPKVQVTTQQIPSSQNNLHTLLGINSTTSFDDLYLKQSNTEYVKKYEVFETTEDILALSVTWHRMRSSLSHKINMIAPDNRPTKLTDSVLFREMIQEDKDRADIIRDYYSKKLMVITLREQRISKFRKDLSTFVHGDNKVVKEEMMPLIYRLPEFYEYDMGFDEMFRDLNKQFEDYLARLGDYIVEDIELQFDKI